MSTVPCHWAYDNRYRVGAAIGLGTVTGILAACIGKPFMPILVGWDAFALIYVIWVTGTVFRLSPEETSTLASREDPGRIAVDLLIVLASVASLGAVAWCLIEAGGAPKRDGLIAIIEGVLSVVLSWSLVHTIYTLRYARLYFAGEDGGIDFNSKEPPTYTDFAYLAFTVGMTFQVSDTTINSREIRRVVLHQALLSYLFGTVIVATTINLVAGLGK